MAGKQMTAGYSGTPLGKKLGLKDGMRALLVNAPIHLKEIGDFPGFAGVDRDMPKETTRIYDYMHVFETDRLRLEGLVPALRASMKPDGPLWISWPKKAAKVPTTITEDALRDIFLPAGLVDVKVAAVDEVWSGLKFMFRKEIRGTL
jgi:hypothetical protein